MRGPLRFVSYPQPTSGNVCDLGCKQPCPRGVCSDCAGRPSSSTPNLHNNATGLRLEYDSAGVVSSAQLPLKAADAHDRA
jgi:hypothetical protein